MSGLEKKYFSNPRLHTFSPSPKTLFLERGFTSSAFSGLRRTAAGFQPLLKLCSRGYARHPCGPGGISPLHPPFRRPLLALSGKVRIKPSPGITGPQKTARVLCIDKPGLSLLRFPLPISVFFIKMSLTYMACL